MVSFNGGCHLALWGQVEYPGPGSKLFHQSIGSPILHQFTERNRLFGGAIGHGIFVLITKPVDTVWACRNAGWKLSLS